jgi:hypothetical protein
MQVHSAEGIDMLRIFTKWPALAAATFLAAACGGGGGGDDGNGGNAMCERVSAGPTSITIRNSLSTGLQAVFEELSFGADMLAGECNIVGFDTAGRSLAVHITLRQCNNTSANSDCTGGLFGPARTRTVNVSPGSSSNVTVDAATFN